MHVIKTTLATAISLICTTAAFAGDLNAPYGPTEASSAMYTLEDLYNRMDAGAAASKRTGPFVEPGSAPASTGHNLDEVMDKAPVANNVNGVLPEGVLAGEIYWSLRTDGTWGPQTGTMVNVGTQNITPGITAKTITQGYHDGDGSVAGDANLVTGNIKAGTTIFGVSGKTEVVDTTTGDALTTDLLSGKKAWVDGSEITGTATNFVAYPALVPESGQTTQYDTNDPQADDGAGNGIDLPSPRFTDNSDGTVTDELTGLMWLKDANCPNTIRPWQRGLTDVVELNAGGKMNNRACKDYSGTPYSDWRLPTVTELQSLIHFGYSDPALSNAAGTAAWIEGDAFSDVMVEDLFYYFSSTTSVSDTSYAWSVDLATGRPMRKEKLHGGYHWPVMGGQ